MNQRWIREGEMQMVRNEICKPRTCFPELGARILELKRFPVDFNVAQLCRALAPDMNQQLWERYCNMNTLHLCLFEEGVKGRSLWREGPTAFLIFYTLVLSSAGSREFGFHEARNLNVTAEVTLPWAMTKISIMFHRLAGSRRNGKGSEERNVE